MDSAQDPHPIDGVPGFIARTARFGVLILAVLVGDTDEQMASWEAIRPGGRRFLFTLGILLGACFSLTFVFPELLIDLLSPPMSAALHYLSPIVGFALLGGIVGVVLFGALEASYRWETTGHKPRWVLRQEESQKASQAWLRRFGPIKYVLATALLGGFIFVAGDQLLLARLRDPATGISALLRVYITGFLLTSFGAGFAVWRVILVEKHQGREHGLRERQEP
jgi:hypothetical protein